ncbi:MAG: hypothetical protein KTR35_00680 [Gammaproteobacteria bacterium]|nr:hypothetical protein [Gammaproteobacteria bacterium]
MNIRSMLLTFLVMPALIVGCQHLPAVDNSIDQIQSNLVAKDFTSALVNLPGYAPLTTTVQLRPASTVFGDHLMSELRTAGYGIQTIGKNDSGPMMVSYASTLFNEESPKTVGFRVRVGGVELGREYEIRHDRLFPITGMSVVGVALSSEPLDDSIFDYNRWNERDLLAQGDLDKIENTQRSGGPDFDPNISQDARVVDIESMDKIKENISSPPSTAEVAKHKLTESILTENHSENWQAVAADPVPLNEGADLSKSSNSQSDMGWARNQNMSEIGQSNFTEFLTEYAVLSESILLFPHDSLRLGRANKIFLRNWAKLFDAKTDLISVIGCSHGNSDLHNGNRFLSVGRANRVKEELIVVGVPPENVLDEGCWTTSHQDAHPRRGVIITHRRKT